MPTYERLLGEMKTHLAAANAIAETAENQRRDFSPTEASEVERHLAMAKELKPRMLAAKADAKLTEKLRALGPDIGTPDTDYTDPSTGRRHAVDPRTGGLAATTAGGSKAWSRTAADRLFKAARDTGLKALTTGKYRRPHDRRAGRRRHAAGTAPGPRPAREPYIGRHEHLRVPAADIEGQQRGGGPRWRAEADLDVHRDGR
jgi:hypothetical protein